MNQQYLITIEGTNEPFTTNWFEYENHYVEGMTVYDLWNGRYTEDGINWKDLPEDHL